MSGDEESATRPARHNCDSTTDGIATGLARGKARALLFGIKPPPQKVGHYTILDRLGAGTMGVVYTALDEELHREVAIKFVSPDREGAEAQRRLYREAQALARVSHPNVVQVHEVGRHDDQVYVVMERGVGVPQSPRRSQYRVRTQGLLRSVTSISRWHGGIRTSIGAVRSSLLAQLAWDSKRRVLGPNQILSS